MLRHVLYSSKTGTIWVLDLPTSIACAQNSVRLLTSTPAIEKPHPTPEPKGVKREKALLAIPPDALQHDLGIQNSLHATLRFLQTVAHDFDWYHPRECSIETQPSVRQSCPHHEISVSERQNTPPLILSTVVNSTCCVPAITGSVVHNPYSVETKLQIHGQGSYHVPPQSFFLNATIEDGTAAFEVAVKHLLPEGHFDLVLLDPPWNNRSVRNSQAYITARNQSSDPFGHVLPLIADRLSSHGYVAVWITNKASVRSQVLEACKLTRLVLVEEWVWLKVTTRGDPVTPLDGIWRKPYELLLLFRRTQEQSEVLRRIVLAVPDVHSRKPSLKSMFEKLLPPNYTALEVFARSLTAGWWSWGDEVLKFQHETCWYSDIAPK